ncbi:MAG: CapA family protein, partial [Gammaproteobacteria bacterium]|nr:CapA family protein [Gammaproteobacteria bacterium]
MNKQTEPVPASPSSELISTEQLSANSNNNIHANRISLALVGDIMLGTDYPKNVLADDDGESLLDAVNPYLQSADITFGNLEGVLLDGGLPEKACKNPDNCHLFRSPSHYAQHLLKAGFDVMSLANNHARDFGELGRTNSMQALSQAGILHSGREGDVAIWEVKGKKIALIAFAPFIGSHDFLDLNRAKQQVQALSQTCDIVIVSMHAGAEGLDATHLPFAKEFYHGEDRGDS